MTVWKSTAAVRSIAKLTQEITDLTAEIAAIDKAVAEATEIREAEKAENTQTIKDSQEAQTAVSQAVTVLKEFYEKAGEATALIQEKKQKPEIFDEPYTGMQSENGGVLGMLEVIASDFARARWGAGADTCGKNTFEITTQHVSLQFFRFQEESELQSKYRNVNRVSARSRDGHQGRGG